MYVYTAADVVQTRRQFWLLREASKHLSTYDDVPQLFVRWLPPSWVRYILNKISQNDWIFSHAYLIVPTLKTIILSNDELLSNVEECQQALSRFLLLCLTIQLNIFEDYIYFNTFSNSHVIKRKIILASRKVIYCGAPHRGTFRSRRSAIYCTSDAQTVNIARDYNFYDTHMLFCST